VKLTLEGNLHVNVVHEDRTAAKLDQILGLLREVLEKEIAMSEVVDNLVAQLRANSDLIASAVILINGIADRITQAGVDPVKLRDLTASLKASDDELAAALVAGTPAA
jgi:hypothetical protein